MKFPLVAAIFLGLPGLPAREAAAQTLLESYTAEIGAADRLNSAGVPLTEAHHILQQDRANLHRFGKRQPGDSADETFSTLENRTRYGEMLARGMLGAGVEAAILSGTNPVVTVEIYGLNGRADRLSVRLAQGEAMAAPGPSVEDPSAPALSADESIAQATLSEPAAPPAGEPGSPAETITTPAQPGAQAEGALPSLSGWHLYGQDGAPAMTWTDGNSVGPHYTCDDGSLLAAFKPVLRVTLPEHLAGYPGEPNAPVVTMLRNSEALAPGYRGRLNSTFYASDPRVIVELPPARPDWLDALPEGSTLDVLHRSGSETTPLMELPVEGLKAPLTELLRICSAGVRAPDAPSFSCIGNLLSEAGHDTICNDSEASARDSEVLRRFLAASEAAPLQERVARWQAYRNWTEARTACFRDMACMGAAADSYLAALPVEAPATAAPAASTVIAELAANPEAALAEALRHGIDAPIFEHSSARSLYFTSDCDYSCATRVYAVHDIGPEQPVPFDSAADLEALQAIGMRYGSSLSLFHLRLGYPLAAGVSDIQRPLTISRENAMAITNPEGEVMRFSIQQTAAPRTWAEADKEEEARYGYAVARERQLDLDLQQRREEARAGEAEQAEQLSLAGQVYKSPGYWMQFDYPDIIRGVFEGERFDPESMAVRQMVGGFVKAFDAKCAAYLPANSPTLSETTIERVETLYGITLREHSRTETFRVHPALAPFLEAMIEAPPTAAEAQTALDLARMAASGGFNIADGARLVAGHALDAQRLVALEACNGAVIEQFFANLSALANGGPTTIEAGRSIPGAAEASDTPPGPGQFASLAEACLEASAYDPASNPRCACVESSMTPEMSQEQLAAAKADFRSQAAAWFHGGDQAETALGRRYQSCVAQTAR